MKDILSRSLQNKTILLLFGMLVPPTIWVVVICCCDVNLPFLDELAVVGKPIYQDATHGSVDFASFYCWHNESKKVIPKLIFFGLYKATGEWNVKLEMLVSIAFGVANCFLVVLIMKEVLRGIKNSSLHHAYLFGLVFSIFYFTPFSYFRWINGITLHRVLPDTLLMLSIVIFLRPSIRSWVAVWIYVLFATSAQFSFSGGVVLWPLALLLVACRPGSNSWSRCRQIALLLTTMFSVQYVFFLDADREVVTTASNTASLLGWSFVNSIWFVLAFMAQGLFQLGPPFSIAALIGLLSMGLLIYFYKMARQSMSISLTVVLGVFLLYPLLLGLLAGIGRDFAAPLQRRYVLYGAYLPLILAVMSHIFARCYDARKLKTAVFITMGVLYVCLLPVAIMETNRHINEISAARNCVLFAKKSSERRDGMAKFIYPSAKTHDLKFEAVDRRFRSLVEKRILR